VATLSAGQAYAAMVNPRSGSCPLPTTGAGRCDWVTITAATPTTVELNTARGPAEVPAWAFTVEGLSSPIVRVSVREAAEPDDFEPQLPAAPRSGRLQLLDGQYVQSREGRTLTVAMGSGSCDSDIAAHVHETDSLVVVGGTSKAPPEGQLCDMMLQINQLTVRLAAPPESRPVIDAQSGRPLLPVAQPPR
jgi:hypothetical protein